MSSRGSSTKPWHRCSSWATQPLLGYQPSLRRSTFTPASCDSATPPLGCPCSHVSQYSSRAMRARTRERQQNAFIYSTWSQGGRAPSATRDSKPSCRTARISYNQSSPASHSTPSRRCFVRQISRTCSHNQRPNQFSMTRYTSSLIRRPGGPNRTTLS